MDLGKDKDQYRRRERRGETGDDDGKSMSSYFSRGEERHGMDIRNGQPGLYRGSLAETEGNKNCSFRIEKKRDHGKGRKVHILGSTGIKGKVDYY